MAVRGLLEGPGGLFAQGTVDLSGGLVSRGYWSVTDGAWNTDNGVSMVVSGLEPGADYLAVLGGFDRDTTAVVALDSKGFSDGVVLTRIPYGVSCVGFRAGASGIVGLCTNQNVLKPSGVAVAKAEPGALATAVGMLAGRADGGTREWLVSPDGSGDFTDPVSCFRAIAGIGGRKRVRIASGEYDVYALMGGDEWANGIDPSSQSWADVQPVLDDVEIIGMGDVTLTMSIPESIDPDKRWLVSPLNLRGDFHVENLTINASGCRYAIHDESGHNYPGTRHEYVNVRCSVDDHQAVGCGYSPRSTVVVDSCRFETRGSGDNAYSWHSKGGASLIMRSTTLISPDAPPLRLSEENSGVTDRAVITDCLLATGGTEQLELRGEWEYTPAVGHTNVTLVNTKVTGIRNGYDTITQPVETINTIQGDRSTLLEPTR